eukprot:136349_1
MLDLDYLKAWNTTIGHDKTDELIKKIGNIMYKYNNEINNGKWINKYGHGSRYGLKRSFIFRTGGDEFVMVIKSGDQSEECKLYNFYTRFKSEINGLGKKYNIKSAEHRKGNKIYLSIVEISCGIYIPDTDKNTESDWLEIADKQALETTKTTNGIKK